MDLARLQVDVDRWVRANGGYREATDEIEGGIEFNLPLGKVKRPAPPRAAAPAPPAAAPAPMALRHALEDLDFEAVQTGEGRRRGGKVLVALGAWSPEFERMIRMPIPIQPGKGYSITYDRPTLAPRRPLVLKERSVCVTACCGLGMNRLSARNMSTPGKYS